MQKQRRNFIKSAALGSLGLGAIASSLLAQNSADKSAQDANTSVQKQEPKKLHYGMIFDQNKCVGCTDCEIACKKVNLVPKGQMRLFIQDKTDPLNLKEKRYVRVSCQQCEDAPCVKVCPTIACKYCIVACPYDVRFINHETKAAESCNFCLDTNLKDGHEPACIEACRYEAIVFGDLNDEGSHISKLLRVKDSLRMHPECGTKPSLRYIPAVKLGV